jgi:hypothetical protein
MQRYTIFFITVNALYVSGGFTAHHQELKNCTHSIWYMSSLLAAVAASKLDILKNTQIPNFIKIHPAGASLFAAGGRTDMTNLRAGLH